MGYAFAPRDATQSLAGSGFRRFSPSKNNCSGFFAENSQKQSKSCLFAQVLENRSVFGVFGRLP
jgi:hypothetical protein